MQVQMLLLLPDCLYKYFLFLTCVKISICFHYPKRTFDVFLNFSWCTIDGNPMPLLSASVCVPETESVLLHKRILYVSRILSVVSSNCSNFSLVFEKWSGKAFLLLVRYVIILFPFQIMHCRIFMTSLLMEEMFHNFQFKKSTSFGGKAKLC